MTNMRTWRIVAQVCIFAASIALAIVLARSGVVRGPLYEVREFDVAASVVGGVMFSSVFAAPLAIVVLAEAAQGLSPFLVALLGGIGAALGDAVIFFFVRDRARGSVSSMYKRAGGKIPRGHLLQRYRWLARIVGVLVIASPFPDEIGVALLGLTNVSTSRFLVITFIANSLGIFLLALASRALA